jgi:hypothetical protein
MKSVAPCLAAIVLGLLCGCGTNSNPCVLGNSFGIGSSSPSDTANHASTPPANQVKFSAYSAPFVVSGTGCALPQYVATVNASWTTSDTKDVTISSAADATNGTATCVNATDGPVTVTATAPTGALDYTPKTSTATMTCK